MLPYDNIQNQVPVRYRLPYPASKLICKPSIVTKPAMVCRSYVVLLGYLCYHMMTFRIKYSKGYATQLPNEFASL